MKDVPLVSIIIPIYNRVDLLKRTLYSIYKQTYANFEVLLIDDASTIRFNLQELESIVGRPISYLRLKTNAGPGTARSMGRTLAKGKYLAYLDSDDEWEPLFLEQTVEVLEADATIAMVFTNVLLKRGQGSKQRLFIHGGAYNFFDLIFTKQLYWATGAALWRSEISLSTHWVGFRDHEDYVHDLLSLLHKPTVYFINEALCIVNKNEDMGIARSNTEMLNSLLLLSKSKPLYETLGQKCRKEDFVKFVMWRLSRRNYTYMDLMSFLKLYIGLLKWSGKFRTFTLNVLKLMRYKFVLKKNL